MKLKPAYLMLIGFAFLITILFLRTTGLHVDEWSYLHSAVETWKDPPRDSGKSALFYWMNYKLQDEIGKSFGPLRPVALYLFYIAAFVTSLYWAIRPLFEDKRRLALVYFVLLLSPLALFNETQLMMETAILPLCSLAFGAVLRGADSNWKLLRLFLLSGLLIAMKFTAAPVVVLLAAVSYRSKRTVMALGVGSIAGYLASQAVLRWIVHVAHNFDYGGLSQLLSPSTVWLRLSLAGPDLYLWVFFVGLSAIAGGLLWAYTRWRSLPVVEFRPMSMKNGALLILIMGSLLLMLFMQSISIYGFARYHYPAFWIGLVASILLVARHRTVALVPLAVVFCFQSLPLFGRDMGRFHLWPSRTVEEFINSGGTILTSTPIHRLVVRQQFRDSAPCFAVEGLDPVERDYYLRYFAFAFPRGKVADASKSCGTTIRVWREPVETIEAACPNRCDESSRWRVCAYQHLFVYTVHHGFALNQVCW